MRHVSMKSLVACLLLTVVCSCSTFPFSRPKEAAFTNTVWQATDDNNEGIWLRVKFIELLPGNSFRGSDIPGNFRTPQELDLTNKNPWRWWLQDNYIVLDFGLPNMIPHKFWFRLKSDSRGVRAGWAEDSKGKLIWDGHTLKPVKLAGVTQ